MDCTVSNISDYRTQDNIETGLSLYKACRTNNVDVVRQALLQGVSVNFSYKSRHPLYVSSENGHTEIVSLLLKHGADVNVGDKWGDTPLHVATERGHTEIVSLLLKHKADVNVQDRCGDTPLHVATERGHTEIVSLLLKHKADVNVQDRCGDTPLHIATERGHTEIVSLLVSNNADVNRTNILGLTPLHLSSECDDMEILSLLLANKADINGRCLDGFTPLYYAAKSRNRKTVDYLLQHGADLHNLSLTRRIGFWWRKISLKHSTTTSVSLTLRPGNEDKKSTGRTLDTIATDIEDCLRAAGRDVETTIDPTPSYENVTINNLSETVPTSESGQALGTAITGRMTQCVTECLKEFPGVYSTCPPDISTQVSSTQQNGTPIVNINVTVNINNEIVIQESKDVKCQKANIETANLVSMGGSIKVVNSSREASTDNEDIDESSDEAEE